MKYSTRAAPRTPHLLPFLIFLLLFLIESAAPAEPGNHSVSVVVDGLTHHLTYRTTDDYHELASAFLTSRGIRSDGSGCDTPPSSSSNTRYGCAVDKLVASMVLYASRQVAAEAASGDRSFDIASGPHGGSDHGRLRSLVVDDDVLEFPHALREFGLSCDFAYKGNHPGQRTVSFANHAAFRPLRRRVEQLVGEPLPYWFASFQRSLANDTDNSVHRDFPTYRYSALLYLTPNSPPGLGTSTWRHRDSGIYGWPTDDEARLARLPPSARRKWSEKKETENKGEGDGKEDERMTAGDLTNWMVEDGVYNEERFEEIDRVGNRFNRLLVFNSRLNHRSSSLGGAGSVPDDARLFLVMFFNTQDKIGQENSVLWCDPDSHEFWGRGDPCGTATASGDEQKAELRLEITDVSEPYVTGGGEGREKERWGR